MRGLGLIVLIGLCALVLIGWNAGRFFGARPVIVTKELEFLPTATTARVLAMGQAATAAKLRWIDSFRFQQLVLDRREDRLPDGSSVFCRLYDGLIPLDPYFLPFYQSASVNLGGILERHGDELRYLQLGLFWNRAEITLHRQLASCLYTFFKWEENNPEALDAVLSTWASDVPGEGAQRQAWIWKAAMARRVYHGLEQLPYWIDQLERLSANGQGRDPTAEYLRETIRDQLTSNATRLIAEAAAGVPGLATEQDAGWQVLAPRIVAALAALPPERQPPSAFMPIERTAEGWRLRHDPWGLPWRRSADGGITCGGLDRRSFEAQVAVASAAMVEAARTAGRWPTTLAEVAAQGVSLPTAPAGGTIVLAGQALDVTWAEPPATPWPLTPAPAR